MSSMTPMTPTGNDFGVLELRVWNATDYASGRSIQSLIHMVGSMTLVDVLCVNAIFTYVHSNAYVLQRTAILKW